MLEFDHVTFRYAKNMPVVLSDTSLKFGKGEFIAIKNRKARYASLIYTCFG